MDGSTLGAQGVAIIGIDGKPQVLPRAPVRLSFAGTPRPDRTFEAPPPGWQPWAAVQAGVGDLPVFSQLLGDGQTPFTGPAALIGGRPLGGWLGAA